MYHLFKDVVTMGCITVSCPSCPILSPVHLPVIFSTAAMCSLEASLMDYSSPLSLYSAVGFKPLVPVLCSGGAVGFKSPLFH